MKHARASENYEKRANWHISNPGFFKEINNADYKRYMKEKFEMRLENPHCVNANRDSVKNDEIIKIEEPLVGDLSFIPLLEDDERKRNKKGKIIKIFTRNSINQTSSIICTNKNWKWFIQAKKRNQTTTLSFAKHNKITRNTLNNLMKSLQ